MTNEIEELEALWAAGPEEIFLQVTGDTGLPIASESDWENNPEITWCAHRVYDLDAPYVRKDKYTTLLQSLKDKDAEIERLVTENSRLLMQALGPQLYEKRHQRTKTTYGINDVPAVPEDYK